MVARLGLTSRPRPKRTQAGNPHDQGCDDPADRCRITCVMRLRYVLLIAAVLLAAAAIAGVAQPQLGRSAGTPGTAARTITVSGSATVTTVPDRASFYFTVDTRALSFEEGRSLRDQWAAGRMELGLGGVVNAQTQFLNANPPQ